jgi:hypothetical protein
MMILPSDQDYKKTKLIKLGNSRLLTPFIELSEWIQNEYGTNVINVYYDYIMPEKCPRLNIVFEYSNDELLFRDKQGNYDAEKQKLIASRFETLIISKSYDKFFFGLISKSPQPLYDTKDMLVTFSSFEAIAKNEANESIPEAKIRELKEEISNDNIWEISRAFSGVTFFFYTKEQVEENSKNGIKEFLTGKYFSLLKTYDEFNYFKKDSYSIYLDSKENFDKNYQSNWFYYYQ